MIPEKSKQEADAKKINEAHDLADKDMEQDKELSGKEDENTDLDEGELARKEGHP